MSKAKEVPAPKKKKRAQPKKKEEVAAPKKRGRPKGSKNKVKVAAAPPKKRRRAKRKKIKKVNPWQAAAEELLVAEKRECTLCPVEQYLELNPRKRNSGAAQKLGHYHGSIFREKNVPGFGRTRWVIGAHILYDWKESEVDKPEKLFEECINYLNYKSVVSDKTDKPYKTPRHGIIDKKPVTFQFREDVYGEGRGIMVLLSVDVKKSPFFWGQGISRSQIIKVENRGRPSSK